MKPAANEGRSDEDAPHAAGVLYRSRIEITRILRQLERDRAVLTAEVGSPGQLFLTRLLHVDADGAFLILEYYDERRANTALLDRESVTFSTGDKQGRIEFTLIAPTDTLFAGSPALRFALPSALLRLHQRAHPRFKIPPDASLRCIADSAGVAPFEARIVDISRGGMGGMLYDPGVKLEPGTVLRACKIILAGHKPVIADLEVRYSTLVPQPDGKLTARSGVRFLGNPEGIEALLARFIIEFDEAPGAA